MNNKEPEFSFEKKLGIAACLYGDTNQINNMISRLMFCMKESNKLNGTQSEFFRLDFRNPYLDEMDQFPHGALILHLKWGSKKELEDSISTHDVDPSCCGRKMYASFGNPHALGNPDGWFCDNCAEWKPRD